MKMIRRYMNTKSNNEDFAITPYLFGVKVIGKKIKVIGLGICWGYASFFLGFGFGVSKNYQSFKAPIIEKQNEKEKFEAAVRETRDKSHLRWIHDRIVNVYGESEDVDFLIKMRDIIDNL